MALSGPRADRRKSRLRGSKWPVLARRGPASSGPTGCDWISTPKRVDENATGFSLTVAVRDGYFTFLGTCRLLGATLPEKRLNINDDVNSFDFVARPVLANWFE